MKANFLYSLIDLSKAKWHRKNENNSFGEKIQHANNNQKKVGISLLILGKEYFKTKNVTADKERH